MPRKRNFIREKYDVLIKAHKALKNKAFRMVNATNKEIEGDPFYNEATAAEIAAEQWRQVLDMTDTATQRLHDISREETKAELERREERKIEAYAIRLKGKGLYLMKGGDLGQCGRVRFGEYKIRTFPSVERAEEARRTIGLCMATIKAEDMEIIDTKNTIDREQWKAIKSR